MKRKQNPIASLALALLMLAIGLNGLALAQDVAPQAGVAAIGSAFTYQGQLQGPGGPVTSTCDFVFSLWDAMTGGTQIGTSQSKIDVAVNNGQFAVTLDFGANAFNGGTRCLEIWVRCPAGSGSYTNLVPRQALRPTPYALYSTNADLLDGQHASAFQQHYQNLIVVAKSGGDFSSIQDALNSITSASDTNRYLVWVAPGTYTERVTMKPYVDIEGAGELLTIISFTGSDAVDNGTVVGSSNAELRFLTVQSTGADTINTAIYNNDNASPRLTHLVVSASGGFGNYGVVNKHSSPTMTNVNVTTSGGTYNYGVFNNNWSSPEMLNVTASGSGGTYNFGVYNNYHSSPMMTNVTASASGTGYSYGIHNHDYSSPTMRNVTASATGEGTGSYTYGVFNSTSSPTMTNVNVTASGEIGTHNYGVYNDSSSPTIQNSVIRSSGGTNDGLHNESSSGNYTITINASEITGGSSTIYQDSHYTTKVGASQLAGGGAFGGTYVCVASYNGNYAALNSSCQP